MVGRVVADCVKAGVTLQDLTAEELRSWSPLFGDDAPDAVAIDAVVSRRTTFGGTAPDAVAEQLALLKEAVAGEAR